MSCQFLNTPVNYKALLCIVLVAIGFVVGVEIQKSSDEKENQERVSKLVKRVYVMEQNMDSLNFKNQRLKGLLALSDTIPITFGIVVQRRWRIVSDAWRADVLRLNPLRPISKTALKHRTSTTLWIIAVTDRNKRCAISDALKK
mgnify:CR=1 FL=1